MPIAPRHEPPRPGAGRSSPGPTMLPLGASPFGKKEELTALSQARLGSMCGILPLLSLHAGTEMTPAMWETTCHEAHYL